MYPVLVLWMPVLSLPQYVRRHRSTFLLTPLKLNTYLGVAPAPVQKYFAQLTDPHRHLDFSVSDLRLIVAILT